MKSTVNPDKTNVVAISRYDMLIFLEIIHNIAFSSAISFYDTILYTETNKSF